MLSAELVAPLTLPRLHVPLARAERPVELTALHVSVEVSGALAVTTWELTFENPNRRTLEGQLEFPLLDGQTVIRFAMDVNGALREAVPVPKDKGRQVFEEIERRDVDPGLLERTAGNSYRARIYPLLPGQRKRVLIAYQEELALRDGVPVYQLALDFPVLRHFSLELSVRGPARAPVLRQNTLGLELPAWREDFVTRAEKKDFAANGLLVVALPPGERPAVTTETFGERTYFRAEQALEVRTRPRRAPRVLGLLWDCSGSAEARSLPYEFLALDAYFKAFREPVEVRLVRVRDVPEETEVFRVQRGDWDALRHALEQTCFDGATSMDGWRPEPGVDAWLLCTDGLLNFGDRDVRPDTGRAPMHVLLSAARSDPARLRALAERSGGEFINVRECQATAAAERLHFESERLLAVESTPREVAQVHPEAPAPLRGQRLVLAGILRSRQATLRVRVGFPNDAERARTFDVHVSADGTSGQLAARAWAALKLASLEPEYQKHRNDIERTARDFGIVTPDTSLIILESVEDYARYDITPPPELRDAWAELVQAQRRGKQDERAARLERVRAQFQQYVEWWKKDFPKGAPPQPKKEEAPTRAGSAASRLLAAAPPPAPSRGPSLDALSFEEEPAMAAAPAAAPAMADMCLDELSSESEESGEGASPRASIRLQKWTPDAPYLDRLRQASDARLYRVYLEERPDYARSTAFFLDAADVFFERKQPALGLRVLSNLAEMELENPAVLRILGYRLLQAGRADLARGVFTQVKQLRPEEPQSYRDLAQACAALGDFQAAVELLWEVVTGEWDHRFPEIELIALTELNALVASCGQKLDLHRMDPRLLRSLPLELRVVLTWDADETDIDLWVTDPNGEKAFYANPLTYQGGRMSRDFRNGYGPEEFSLRQARPGQYTVEANYYGNSQQIIAGATTLQLQFITDFGTPRQQEQRVTLRLREAREVVTVGQFVVEGRKR